MNALLAYVVNAAWQIPLAAAGALALTRIARPPAAWCSRLLSALLLLAVLLPALPLFESASASAPPAPPSLHPMATTQALAMGNPPLAQSSGAPFAFAQWQVSLILAALAIVIAIAAARLIFAAIMTRLWLRRSRGLVLLRDVALNLECFAGRSGIAAPAVRLSSSLTAPAVVGVFTHTIMLPEHLSELEPEALRAVLLHECAHIARRDYAANWACELLSLPVCWHPLLTILKRELRMARELACDQMAASAMPSPVHYATRLLQVARSGVQQRSQRLQMAPSLIGDGQLERRIKSIVDRRMISRLRRIGEAVVTGALFVGFGTLVALLRITPAIAQDQRGRASTIAAPVALAESSTPAPQPTATSSSARPLVHVDDTDQAGTPTRAEHEPIVVKQVQTDYVHKWVSSSGRHYSTLNNDPAEPSDEQKRLVELRLDDAEVATNRAATVIESERRDLELRAAATQSAADSMRGGVPTGRIKGTAATPPDGTRQWRVVRPEEMPIVARGNQALKVLPDGTVLFSEAPDG